MRIRGLLTAPLCAAGIAANRTWIRDTPGV